MQAGHGLAQDVPAEVGVLVDDVALGVVRDALEDVLPGAVAAGVGLEEPPERVRRGPETRLETLSIWWVIAKRREVLRRQDPDATYMDALRGYTAGRLWKCDTPRQCWISEIEPGGGRPEHWPEERCWPGQRLVIERTAGWSRQWLRGELSDPCPEADHWGTAEPGSIDMRRATRAGWERLECPGRNAFWRVPE